MTKGPSPLLGFNNNIRHKGKLFHIQTEDSGVRHPHVITHLFTDGGRIIKTTKTSYVDHLSADNMAAVVRQLMKEQHKAMFVALRDGLFDPLIDRSSERMSVAPLAAAVIVPEAPPTVEVLAPPEPLPTPLAPFVPPPTETPRISPPLRPPAPPLAPVVTAPAEGKISESKIAVPHPSAFAYPPAPTPSKPSRFGGDLISEKSLDEVILSYLAEDLELPEPGKKK